MTVPIDKAAAAIGAHMRPVLDLDLDVARAVFESIDEADLARAITASLKGRSWRDLTPRAVAEAVKAHLLKEDS